MQAKRARLSFAVAFIWLAALLLPVGIGLASPGRAYAQTKSYHMDRYDSEITVNPDGSLDIRETLVFNFTSGSFRRGLREFDTDKLDNITGIKVAEDRNGLFVNYTETSFEPDDSTSGATGTYGIDNAGSSVRVRWIFGNTSNAVRTFRVTYHVNGAIRVYDDRDEFDWYAVPPGWGAPINASRVQVTFPRGDTADWKLASVPADAEVSTQGNSAVWTANSRLGAGFEVGAQLPKGILQAAKPSWQANVDQQELQREEDRKKQEEYDKNVRPLVDVGLLLLGVVTLIGGVLWMISRWYTKGRDKVVKLPTDYLTEPPSDLPPGLVGTLLDESADIRDVIATVVDMGRKGNLTINEEKQTGLFGGKDFQYTQTGGTVQYRFEELVMNALFKDRQSVNLTDLKNTFYTNLPPIYSEMYDALVELKYFPENPKAVRGRNMGLGCVFVGLAIVVGFLWVTFGALYSYMMLIPAIGLGVTGLVGLILAGAMPRKTDLGSEEAAKWNAFKRYLQQIQSYTNVQEAADRFQKYLPYAVALGVDREFTRQFNSVPAAMPMWYIPYGYVPYAPYYGGSGGTTLAGNSPGGAGAAPNLDPGGAMQGMSDSLSGAMSGLSDSFTSMVNSASSIMTSQPSSSGSGGGGGGGGWGGGGGSFGGGGGGGGGGGAN
ncbi:MAG: DUF2207 domain-containing protein [Chloroflexota bacterium]